jgi:hypothetical protein
MTIMLSAAAGRAKTATTPRSNVDVVIDRLHPDILASLFGPSYPHDHNATRRRASLVADANESLRLLKVRRLVLVPKDTAMVRAALVIEYLGRNAPSTITNANDTSNATYRRATVPLTMLASAAGFSNTKKDRRALEVMQTVIASHLDGSSIGKRQQQRDRIEPQADGRRTGGKRDASPSAARATASRGGPTTLQPTDLIRDLCIRLGPMIPDADFAASYALRMFRYLASGNHIRRSEDNDDRGGGASKKRPRFTTYELQRDMERYPDYYEAACFYLAVKRSEGDNAHFLINGSNKNKTANAINPRATRKGDEQRGEDAEGSGEDGGGEDDAYADDERHLTEIDVIAEANLLECTFKTVLSSVRDLTNGASFPSMVAGDGVGGTRVGSSTLFEVAGKKGEIDGRPGTDPSDSAFEQWKRRVLQEAKTASTKEIGRQDDDGDWLTRAADEVLRRAGLEL